MPWAWGLEGCNFGLSTEWSPVDGISQNCFLNATTCNPMAPTTAAMPGAGMRLAGMAAHGAGAFGFGVVVVAARFTEITESTESH